MSYSPNYIKPLRRILRKKSTWHETVLWKKLRNKKLMNLRFQRQYSIGRYILDFYCHEAKIAIEVDGNIHDSDHQRKYDAIRTCELNNFGIRVLRIKNDEVKHDINGVMARIIATIRTDTSVAPSLRVPTEAISKKYASRRWVREGYRSRGRGKEG
jgi:very-short-patch-repair endonuclease